jgi:drug/metabolite transporter (DMT)-like permease
MSPVLAPDSITVTPSRPHRHSVRAAYLMMLTSSLLFAIMSACSHAAGERSDWRLTALARAGLVFVFSLVIAKANRVRLVWRRPGTLWVRSLTGSVSMLLAFYALTHLHVATAVTLTNTFPLWVTLLAWPAFGHRPTASVILALISGLTGVALVSGIVAEITNQQGIEHELSWASGAALASAICSAVVMLGLHKLRKVHTLAIVVHFSAVATVFIGSFALWTHFNGWPIDFAPLTDAKTIALLLAIGVCATTGQILMTRAFHVAAPQRLSVIGLAQVPFALGLDLFGWKREPEWLMLLGIALVVAPVAWLLRRKSKREEM